jgi:replicative DNA helicase
MTEQLPHAIDSEVSTLGAILIEPDMLPKVKAILAPADFFNKPNAELYEVFLYLDKQGVPIDLRTVSEELRQRESSMKDSDISRLINGTPHAYNAEAYAAEVRKARIQRLYIQVGSDLTKAAWGANGNLPEVSANARAGLAEGERLMLTGGDGHSLKGSISNQLDRLERRGAVTDAQKLELPWRDFRPYVGYLTGGRMLGLAAESGVGKTAFFENCAEAWAKGGWRVALFHLELSDEEMENRRTQRHTGIAMEKLQFGDELSDREYARIFDASEHIARWSGDIRYIHCPGWTMAQIMATAQKLDDAYGLDVILLDYLNKISHSDNGWGMTYSQMMGQSIEEFKIGLEVNGWFGAMAAQFDKRSKGKDNQDLGNILGTSQFEHKTNIGVVLKRPKLDGGPERAPNTLAHVVKGPRTGTVPLYFKSEKLKFELAERT